MSRLLCADLYRMYRGIIFWTSLGSMFGIAGMLSVMQYTSMSYEVPLSRVIFLPMSFYGVIAAALVSFFVGEDYYDGVIRNKLVSPWEVFLCAVYADRRAYDWSHGLHGTSLWNAVFMPPYKPDCYSGAL